MTNTATRFWVAAFVVLVFVSGVSIGLGLDPWMGARAPADGSRGPARSGFRTGSMGPVSARIIGRLQGEPDFTTEQRERLEELFAERQGRFLQFNRDMRERFEAEQASLRNDVAAILTPAQMESFETARREGRGRPRPMRGP